MGIAKLTRDRRRMFLECSAHVQLGDSRPLRLAAGFLGMHRASCCSSCTALIESSSVSDAARLQYMTVKYRGDGAENAVACHDDDAG